MRCDLPPRTNASRGHGSGDTGDGSLACLPRPHAHWVLHQTSRVAPEPWMRNRSLHHLPRGTTYRWHSDVDVCDFIRTQPLRFRVLFNSLTSIAHQTDLWRYLLLYAHGGIYLDEDARLDRHLNRSFLA